MTLHIFTVATQHPLFRLPCIFIRRIFKVFHWFPCIVLFVKPFPLDQVECFTLALFGILDVLNLVRLVIIQIPAHGIRSFEKFIHVTSPVTPITTSTDWATVFKRRLSPFARCSDMPNIEIEGGNLHVTERSWTFGVKNLTKLTKPEVFTEQRAFHRKLVLSLFHFWLAT